MRLWVKTQKDQAMENPEKTEREIQLEGALTDILDCLKARADLAGASAYKGMGINIMQEKAGKLPAAIRWAEMVLGRE
jgi:hypothetical protein